MRPTLHMVTYFTIAASLVGCGMNTSKTRTSGYDTERRATSDRITASDETRVRTTDQTRMRSNMTEQDAALASVVRGRIGEDQTINPKRLTVEADRGTVYLNGAVDTSDQKMRAEQLAMQTTGVSSVVNDLRVQPAMSSNDPMQTTNRNRSCTLVWKNPAIRTESSFDVVELRVYEDIGSPLYEGPRDRAYRDRTYEERQRSRGELRSGTSEESGSAAVTGQASVEKGLDRVGRTGGTMQNSGSAQQGGTFQQTGREPVDLNSDPRVRTNDERARVYGEEARLASRGDLIWSGWLKPAQNLEITSASGPIRYDYRFRADDRFHGNKGAWCNNGHRIAVP